jgi:Cu-Zn family superoxide dismutase
MKGIVMRTLTLALLAAAVSFPLFALAQEKEKPAAHEPPVPKRAMCVLMPTEGNKTRGVLTLMQGDGFVQITGKVEGLETGMHGFHIHEFGDLSSADGKAAGDHFNPTGHKHGGPDSKQRHAGDLGNINAKAGAADVMIKAEGLKLHFIIGRSLVVHAKADDFKTQPSGDSGDRIAVGVIGLAADKTPSLK